MRAAILGFGTVGSGIYEIITQASPQLQKKLSIAHILIRKGKAHTHADMCEDMQTILQDDSCTLVMECMGGIEPAHTYILQALRAGKHVITANKAVVAAYMEEFHTTARQHHVCFAYEASVGGGIPWLHGLCQAMRIDTIDELQGIFNGTSNFILDRMERYGMTFNDALQQAQQLGYAEADPSADIDGIDIANKLRISASLAYHHHLKDAFSILGIRHVTKADIDTFRSWGLSLRLVGKSFRHGNRYCCHVEPTLIKQEELSAHVQDNYNLISLYGKTIGQLSFFGQGAGKLPTAHAMLQDALDIIEQPVEPIILQPQPLYFDDTLQQRDYVLRTTASLQAIPWHMEIKEGYIMIKNMHVKVLRLLLQQVHKEDAQAFIACLPQ